MRRTMVHSAEPSAAEAAEELQLVIMQLSLQSTLHVLHRRSHLAMHCTYRVRVGA